MYHHLAPGIAGTTLAGTGFAALHLAWLAVACFTIGFALLAAAKLVPRRTR